MGMHRDSCSTHGMRTMFGGAVMTVCLGALLGCSMDKAKADLAQRDACTLRKAADIELVTSGQCPTIEQLVARKQIEKMPLDPWGNGYSLRCEPSTEVRSNGPDGKAGTADDVST